MALTFSKDYLSRSAADEVLEAWDDLVLVGEKTASNIFSEMKTQKGNSPFRTVAERLARKGSRIFARVVVDRKNTWRSTKTNKLPQAKKWLEKWDGTQWAIQNGILPTEIPTQKDLPLSCNALLDVYKEAGHPIVKKRSLRPKAARSIRNEEYCLTPLRTFFREKDARMLGLGDCDAYRRWRNSGGYVAEFKVRGKPVTKKTRGGDRAVDLELIVLSNALQLAVRRGLLPANPIRDRGQYVDESKVRHCREVAPTPMGLVQIVDWLETSDFQHYADLARFLAYTGLRISEAFRVAWTDVDWNNALINVHRSKKGIFPWALILSETAKLLCAMRRRSASRLLFPSPFDVSKALDASAFRHQLARAAKKCGLGHVTPHGLRSYFVTQCRLSGLSDAEIAVLIGDKTGPLIIAEVYGDCRPDHVLNIARQIKLTAQTRAHTFAGEGAKTEGGN